MTRVGLEFGRHKLEGKWYIRFSPFLESDQRERVISKAVALFFLGLLIAVMVLVVP